MAQAGQELEVKFLVEHLRLVEARLTSLGAQLVQARQYEANLRFDTPDRRLSRQQCALRLRQDDRAHLTYKGPSFNKEGASLRQELEFIVSDFAMARAFLETLGFQVMMMYEKYRASYDLDGSMITLDELPYGNFVEIEGQDAQVISSIAQQLGLDWEKRCLDGYIVLFDRVRQQRGFEFSDLSFANFVDISV